MFNRRYIFKIVVFLHSHVTFPWFFPHVTLPRGFPVCQLVPSVSLHSSTAAVPQAAMSTFSQEFAVVHAALHGADCGMFDMSPNMSGT